MVTDTTACLPPELAAELGIEVLPLLLLFAERVYQDGLTESVQEFYETLRTAAHPPTTSAPSPGAYAEAFLRAADDAETVLCITVSRQFSAMYDAAVQGATIAREQRPGVDIRVIDSRAAAMAQGFVTLAAARAAQRGEGIEEVLARAEAVVPKVQLLVVIDTLTYLARSGRVPRLIVWASSPLQLKPIVQFQGGAYRPVAFVRTMPRALDRLVQLLERRTAGGRLHVCVHHTNVPQQADELAARVRATLRPEELFVREFTQVMGVHTGPGLLGFSFYVE